MSKLNIILNVAKISASCLTVVLLGVSTLHAVIHSYLLIFLSVSLAFSIFTLIAALIKRQVHWKVSALRSVRLFVLHGVFRNICWIVMGICAYIAVPHVQFTDAEFQSIRIWIIICVVCLCLLEWVPRKRYGFSVNLALGVILVFLTIQLFMIYLPDKSKERVVLNPMVDEDWFVIQGGNSALLNHHFYVGSQKHALDIFAPADGRLPLQQVNDLNSYKSFGALLYSPLSGEVVAMQNTLPDQAVGETDARHLAGNYLVIRTESDVYLLLAHLQKNSVLVSVGDQVSSGQKIARIGNSGNTSQPHLHVHAMTKADFLNPDSQPVPVYFKDGVSQLKSLKRNDLVKGLEN
jgi:hypothetical protein